MTFPGVEGLRIPATLEAARSARHRVRGACEGLSEEQTAGAVLLTSELVSNAVRHPLRDESDTRGAIVLSIYRTAEVLRVEVGDNDSHPLPRVRRPDTPLESGMGLYLVAPPWQPRGGASPATMERPCGSSSPPHPSTGADEHAELLR